MNPYPLRNLEHAWQMAYLWVCQRRLHYPANADIWQLRFHWPERSCELLTQVLAGRYRLSAMQVIGGHAIWSAQDALVLKWVALLSAPWLPLHLSCEHIAGMGVRASRHRLHQALLGGDMPFMMRTDIRGYYQHIDKQQVMAQLVSQLPSPVCRGLIAQYLDYSVEQGGEFHTPERGIGRGCALSPLIGASLLYPLDAELGGKAELYYARYMDDFIILARTRWRLRRAIACLNGHLAAGGFVQHPDKTLIGRTERGFDWLGGWFNGQGQVGIAPRALQKYRTRALRLYEQALRQGASEPEAQARVQQYRVRWKILMRKNKC